MWGPGFTGLAAASWLRLLAPEKSVAVFEAFEIGAGASGRTGGLVLTESAAGDLPGLGDVLSGFSRNSGNFGDRVRVGPAGRVGNFAKQSRSEFEDRLDRLGGVAGFEGTGGRDAEPGNVGDRVGAQGVRAGRDDF